VRYFLKETSTHGRIVNIKFVLKEEDMCAGLLGGLYAPKIRASVLFCLE